MGEDGESSSHPSELGTGTHWSFWVLRPYCDGHRPIFSASMEKAGEGESACPHLLKERCHGAGEGSQGRKHIVHHIQLCFLQNQGWAANVGV